MPRTAPEEQTAGHVVTTTEYNDQLIKNLNFLLGLKRNGSALTGLPDDSEIVSNLIASNGANPIVSSSGITISGIPQTYRHLRLIVTCQSDDAIGTRSFFSRVGNGSLDAGTNYLRQSIGLTNATPAYETPALGGTTLTNIPLSLSVGIYTYVDMFIPYYTVNGIKKNVKYEAMGVLGTASADQNYWLGRGLWNLTNPIDTVGFFANTGDMRNIRYELYGVV